MRVSVCLRGVLLCNRGILGESCAVREAAWLPATAGLSLGGPCMTRATGVARNTRRQSPEFGASPHRGSSVLTCHAGALAGSDAGSRYALPAAASGLPHAE